MPKTKPITPSEAGPLPLLGLPAMPAPKVPIIVVVVAVPWTHAQSPLARHMPKRVIEVEGEPAGEWRAA